MDERGKSRILLLMDWQLIVVLSRFIVVLQTILFAFFILSSLSFLYFFYTTKISFYTTASQESLILCYRRGCANWMSITIIQHECIRTAFREVAVSTNGVALWKVTRIEKWIPRWQMMANHCMLA